MAWIIQGIGWYYNVLMKLCTSWRKGQSIEDNNNRDWQYLPAELMMSILERVNCYDVLMNVNRVCKPWHRLCKDPSMWRFVEIRRDVLSEKIKDNKAMLLHGCINYKNQVVDVVDYVLEKMTMHVVDLSCGQLLALCIQGFGSPHLLQYIYQRSSHLRHLRLEYCFVHIWEPGQKICIEALIQMLENLPLLEELHLPYTFGIYDRGRITEVAGRCCTHLKSFTLNQGKMSCPDEYCDEAAFAIAKHMPGLRHLQVLDNSMTITGLLAILKDCRYLESLDLRRCDNLCIVFDYEPALATKLRQQLKHVKHVRFPKELTEDYKYLYNRWETGFRFSRNNITNKRH